MAFKKRVIQVTIQLASGSFSSGGDTVTLPPLRTVCRVNKAGGLSDSTLDMQIYGMSLSLMNQLSTLGVQINLVPKNSIVVTAGNEGESLGTVFVGYILQAYSSFAGVPDVPFHVTANTAGPFAAQPAPVSSFKGPASATTILSGIATKMALKFENSGVNVQLSNPYYYGSLMSQLRDCVRDANVDWIIDNGTLAIWPKYGSRGGQVPLIAQGSGLIGWPSYNPYGIVVTSEFNPSIGFGQKIEVRSQDLPRANGMWTVYSLDHELAAEMPGGKWQSVIGGYNPNNPTPAVAPARQ